MKETVPFPPAIPKRKKNEQVRLMFSMGELTHEGGFGCLFVICYREKMVERM
jgi:hypothetical protein